MDPRHPLPISIGGSGLSLPAMRFPRWFQGWLEHGPVVWIVDVVLVLVGTGFVIGGLAMWKDQQPIPGGVITTGRIVRIAERVDEDNQTFRFPVIQYTDRFERVHTFEGLYSGFGGTVGHEVRVRYDPDDPARAQWVDQPGRGLWIAFFGVGVATWLVAVGIWCRRWGVGRRASRGEPAVHERGAS